MSAVCFLQTLKETADHLIGPITLIIAHLPLRLKTRTIRSQTTCIFQWYSSCVTFLEQQFFGANGDIDQLPGFVHVLTHLHYIDVIMGSISSQITSLTIVYSTVHSGKDAEKTSKLRGTGLCAGNSQMASNEENDSIRWRHHEIISIRLLTS